MTDEAKAGSAQEVMADSRPVITVPYDGYIMKGRAVLVMGFMMSTAASVQVFKVVGDSRVLVGSGIGANTFWFAILTILPGVHTIVAKFLGSESESDPVTFEFIYEELEPPFGPPVIVSPAEGFVVDRNVTIGGTGSPGATVRAFKDLSEELVGTAIVGEGGSEGPERKIWAMPLSDLPPGNFPITAIQTLGETSSPRSKPRLLKVRPPELAEVKTEFPALNTVKFSGTGFDGATVEISVVSGPEGVAPPAIVVKNGVWETTATNWPIGQYRLLAIQKVSDNAGGWIPSQAYSFTVDLVLGPPTDVTYTAVYTPTFSGSGVTGATILITDPASGALLAPAARVTDQAWSTAANTEWGPTKSRSVRVVQQVGDRDSDPVDLAVTIAPLAPLINDILPGEDSPLIEGRCWPRAVVKLKYSDNATEHQPVVTNGRWSHRREGAFAPGDYTVTVTQTAAQQTSPPASKPFTVLKPIPKPTIDPVGSETGRDLTVNGGNGMKDATMQLRDAQYDRPLGQPRLLTSDGAWSIELKGLEFRLYTIDAQQSFDNRKSQRSEFESFTVVLLSPVFEVPQPGGNLPRTSELSGWGMPGGRVDVWLQGGKEPLLKGIPVDANGRWKAEVTLPIGVTTIWARQFFEDQTSRDSPLLTYNVVPAAPFMETPATGEHIGRAVVVSGFGVSGDTVTVKLGDAVLGQSPVLKDRTWSVTGTLDQPGGAYGLVAVASCEGFESADSSPRSVVLGTYLPSIDVPAAGRWVSNPVGFEGQGRQGTGQLVSWFNPEHVWVPNIPATATGWQGQSAQRLPPGGNWCRFKQTIDDGADASTVSDWVESARFEGPAPA